MSIFHRCHNVRMAQKLLHRREIDASSHETGSEGVVEIMEAALGDACLFDGVIERSCDTSDPYPANDLHRANCRFER